MFRTHVFEYVPLLIGGKKRYTIDLDVLDTPIAFKTMTTDMSCWNGQVIDIKNGRAKALIYTKHNGFSEVVGDLVDILVVNSPCIVSEHLKVDGKLDYFISSSNIICNNINFINFGVPNKKFVRIDIYTGEHILVRQNDSQ